jgi:AcrR family transcriptional regulator
LTFEKTTKVQTILKGAVKVLANKGYEGATIIEIAEAAGVSRGVLHYYFKDKEDIAKALASSSSQMVQSSLEGLKGKSTEEIANNVIDMYKKNVHDNYDFYRFLFDISCLSRRSKKVYHEFIICQDKVIDAIVYWLEDALDNGFVNFKLGKAEYIANILLYIKDGVAFHMIDRPNTIYKRGI